MNDELDDGVDPSYESPGMLVKPEARSIQTLVPQVEMAGTAMTGGEIEVRQAGEIARVEAELKAAVILARQFPRDMQKAHVQIMRSCQRPSFVQNEKGNPKALYRYPRGGSTIEGPSVTLAREMARIMGHMRYGIRILASHEEMVHIQGWAYDCETNSYREAEDIFQKLIERKGQGWIKPDERDLRELIFRRGAILVRNAILQLMPPDYIDDAVKEIKTTMVKIAHGELQVGREEAIKTVVRQFDMGGVTTDMLTEYLGHELALINAAELAELRTILKTLQDGMGKREEYFNVSKASRNGPERAMVDLSQVKPTDKKPEPHRAAPPVAPPASPAEAPKGKSTPPRAPNGQKTEALAGLNKVLSEKEIAVSSMFGLDEEAFAALSDKMRELPVLAIQAVVASVKAGNTDALYETVQEVLTGQGKLT